MLWGLRPVEQQAAYGLAVEVLRRQIHLGLIEPGERLPAERALAEQLAVSRVTLREALRVLETEGYVLVRRGARGGTFVQPADALQDLALRRFSRDPASAMRVIEFREANEVTAARLAADRRTPTDLAALASALTALRRSGAAATFRRTSTVFHLALGEASHNPLLARAVEEAHAAMFLPQPAALTQAALGQAVQLREQLLDAVAARRADDAEAAARDVLARDRTGLWTLPQVA